MKSIDPFEIPLNFIRLIGKEWMLVTAGTPEKFNTMTASWGTVGVLWNKPIVQVFIRPERYTFEFMEAGDHFSLSFLKPEFRDAHKITGSRSGRDTDKIALTGLHPVATENGTILYEENLLGLECRKLYREEIREDKFRDPEIFSRWYNDQHGQPHVVFTAEIVKAWIKE